MKDKIYEQFLIDFIDFISEISSNVSKIPNNQYPWRKYYYDQCTNLLISTFLDIVLYQKNLPVHDKEIFNRVVINSINQVIKKFKSRKMETLHQFLEEICKVDNL